MKSRIPNQLQKRIIGLICAFLALVVALIVYVNYSEFSYGWFATSAKTTAGGMKAKIKVSPDLVVSDTLANLQKAADDSATYFTVNWEAKSNILECVTHDWTVGTTNGLKYNSNNGAVSRTTGMASGSTALEFADAVNGTDGNGTDHQFFVDYVVYIATINDTIAGALNVTVETESEITNAYKAVSIDFYVGSVSEATYKGTLNLAGVNYQNDGTAITTLELADSVPLVTETPLCVTLRCYFDGGLIDRADTGKTYIRSRGLALTENFTFDIRFAVEE